MPTIDLFAQSADFEMYPAGDTIFTANERGECMYAVLEGEVNIMIHGKVAETTVPGSILGEMALVEPDHFRSATAVAKTDCKLVPIDEKRFTFLIQQTPYFAIEVMQIMADRLRRWSDLFPQKLA